ncbi:MAG: class I SAM-dependent methyltransferase [Candidatus Shapirobacteria bacterium]|nr:class I SAM-dependent methyltransferase [Candidatus Shapirobacteria bacterium]MDD4410528.1 class I SAM-dependent methyltransferase [Candidatus Shapirobacteria bacterium]
MKNIKTRKQKWLDAQKGELKSWTIGDLDCKGLINSWKNRINNYKIDFSDFKVSTKILDVGCGPVSILEILPKSKTMIATDSLNDKYQKYFFRKNTNIEYKNFAAENIPYKNNYFDVIFCLNAFDHLEKPFVALSEMLRVLKTSGRIYVEFENTSPMVKFLSRFGYKKPLSQFHPHLLSLDNIEKYIKKNHQNVNIEIIDLKPEFNFNKIIYLIEIILRKKKMTKSETNISAISAGPLRFFFHYIIIVIERLFFIFNPKKYSYFNIIVLKKIK